MLFYFTAFLALIKSIIERNLKECRPESFRWVHLNSNPVIQFSSTAGFQCTGIHGRRQVYTIYRFAETRFEGNSENSEIKFTLLELQSQYMNMENRHSVVFRTCQHVPTIHYYLRIQNEALKRFASILIENKCKSVCFFLHFLLTLTIPEFVSNKIIFF